MRLNKVLTSKTSRHNCGQLLSVVLVYLRMHGISHVLGCSTYYPCGGKKEHYVWSI